jgi:transcription antitermination factor NusB
VGRGHRGHGNGESDEKVISVKSRRKARELALQALYGIEITGEPCAKVLEDIKREDPQAEEVWEYASRLVLAVDSKLRELDALIKQQCDNWDLARVALLDKNILRMAITEILFFDDIPPKVSIDEAIELAKKFSTEKSGIFINGILDPIAFKNKQKKVEA